MRRIVETKSAYVKMLAVAVAVVMGVAAVALVVPAAMAAPSHHASPATGLSQFHIAKAKPPKVKHHTFAGTYVSDLLAAYGTTVLVINLWPNGTYETVLWDAATGAVLCTPQKVVPGGVGVYPLSVVSAGNTFFFNWYNTSTNFVYWEEVTPTCPATVTNVTSSLPKAVGPDIDWEFLYGTSTAAYVAEAPYLVELKAPSLSTVVQNYSKPIPAGLYLADVLPEGKNLYAIGEQFESAPYCNAYNCGSYSYFGVFTVSKGKASLTTIISPTTLPKQIYNNTANISGGFQSMVYIKPYVYICGYLSVENLNPAEYLLLLNGAYFYQYDTSTKVVANLTSGFTAAFPTVQMGFPAVEPWSKAVIVSASYYWVNLTIPFGTPGYYSGGFYKYTPSTSSWTNISGYFPKSYYSGAFFVTAESAGWFITGGSINFVGTVVALKV